MASFMRSGPATEWPFRQAHCLINNSDSDVRLLIVGENIAGDRVAYPIDPDQRRPEDDWTDAPRRPLGPHNGRADKYQR
jgi:uncharacterized cupin superfamily protein